jgi:hypothetical protein
MSRHCIRVGDDTEICVDDETGYLWERGKNFPAFHRTAIDTAAILKLLSEHSDAILSARERERRLGMHGTLQSGTKEESPTDATTTNQQRELPL